MNVRGIIAISGRPGLFKVVAQSKNSVIVESLIDKKRFPAYASEKISTLEDISIFTYEDDVKLTDVFQSIFDKHNGGEGPSHKESLKNLEDALESVLPNYDRERVYPSDVKKIFQWYNLLLNAGLLVVSEEAEVTESTEEKKPEAKEVKIKKEDTKKAAVNATPKAAKPAAAKKATAVKTGVSRGK